jgi:site-specific DNA recombinase
MKAAIYTRVSTFEQSTQRQVDELKIYAKNKGYEVSEEDIYEEYKSGYSKKNDRIELNKLLNNINQNQSKYDAIFISEISRLARDPNLGRRIVDDLSERKIKIYVKNPELVSLNSSNERDSIFNIIFQILAEFANSEALFIKMRQKSGIKSKALNGGYVGGVNINYGYKKVEDKYAVDEEEANVVRNIFDMCNQGFGLKKIADYLNNNGIKTRVSGMMLNKMVKQKNNLPPVNSDEIKWKDGTVHGILTNSIYYGKKRYRREPTDSDEIEKMVIGEKTYNLVDVPSIIDKKVFDQAQTALSSRIKHSRRNTKFEYILKDLLICGVCGSNYCGRMRTNLKDQFYFCRSKETKTRTCNALGIGIELIESAIWTVVVDTSLIENFVINKQINIEEVEKEIESVKSKIEELKKDKRKMELSKGRLQDDYYSLNIDYKNYIQKLNLINGRFSKNKNEINESENRVNTLSNLKATSTNLQNLRKLKNSLETDRLKIREIFQESFHRISIFVIDKSYAIFSIVLKNNPLEEATYVLNRKYKYVFGYTFSGEFHPNSLFEEESLRKINLIEWDNYGRLITPINDVYNNIYYQMDYLENLIERKTIKWISFFNKN